MKTRRLGAAGLACALLGAISLTASAAALAAEPKALDAALDCSSNGHRFIAPLAEAGDIQTKPMHVESNSMNAFHTEHPLSAYGFSVYVVLGYQQDDPLFQHGDGKPIGEWGYGVVVRGSKSAVEAKVRAAGSQATVKAAFPFLTAIVCTP
ncbi:hypothetical protein [Burkholderia gladioli]|uniref:hypothetical protein n=1 Tax=Burkholderia gladioli TaxID=28095 RepID=UPI001FC82244|nr:hypothetical protein [Burkholderia gladioli]